MFELDRPVRWNDVDAAGIVFFPRFLEYCHDAIEALLSPLDGGYARLTQQRRLGLPSVHLEADFRAPLRYGDVCHVQLSVAKIGRSSVTFRHVLSRVGAPTGTATIVCCVVRQIVVVSDLVTLEATAMPDDVRVVLEAHRDAPST